MKYIITGGAGFIGSNLANKLLKLHFQVFIIDNLSTGHINNIRPFLNNPYCGFKEGDIKTLSTWEGIPEKGDIIFHLAATVGVNKVCADPFETVQNNIAGVEMVLQIALNHKCKVIFASSSEVYGHSPLIKKEDDPLMVYTHQGGRSSYVLSKLIGEHLCFNFYTKFNLPVIICRFFNIAGFNQSAAYGMVVPTFIHQASEGLPITVYGGGHQKRSFCNVEDLIKALLCLINCDEAWGQLFNIGNTESITIRRLAEFVKRISKTSSHIVDLPLPFERADGKDIFERTPSIEKITSLTSWSPQISWRQTVKELVASREARSTIFSPNIQPDEEFIYG